MDITFVVTGKAGKSGHEQWRKVNDEDYSTRIYTHSKREASETSRLEIEIREYKGEVFTYYTYLIVKNVAQVKSKEDEDKHEKHGRTGSFFGMTIRIKGGYIPNVSGLYNLFENVFEHRIRGTILTDENTDGYLTFLIEKLSDGENSFILAENDILSAISASEITVLPDNSITQQQKTGEVKTNLFNVRDTGHSSFLQALFNDAEVNVSRDYDTIEQIEIRRKQGEEQKKKDLEKASITDQPSYNTIGSSDRRRDIRSSASGIKRGSSSSQSQMNSMKSSTGFGQYDYSSPQNDQYNRLVLKLISIVLEISKVLLSFIARQKVEEKSETRDSYELLEYENKLHQISKDLESINKQGWICDKVQNADRLTRESPFSLFDFKKNDYKLLIPLGVILIIVIGFFIGMRNSDDESCNRLEEELDSAKNETISNIDTTNVIVEDTLPVINTKILKYKVKSSANMRIKPKTGGCVVTLTKNAIFYVSKDTLEGTWVYGETEDKKSGYIQKSLLDSIE